VLLDNAFSLIEGHPAGATRRSRPGSHRDSDKRTMAEVQAVSMAGGTTLVHTEK